MNFYRGLRSGGPDPGIELLDPLALRRLLFDEDGAEVLHTCSVAMGPVRWAIEGLPTSVLDALPLAGHVAAVPTSRRRAALTAAAEELSQFPRWAQSVVADFTSLLVWLRVPAALGERVTALTSASLPQLPHATFVTDKALEHIPPNDVFGGYPRYALAENILHEALHQQLAATLLQHEVLRPDYDAKVADKVAVPWRGAAWEPDRVLHAVFVYRALCDLRRGQLESGRVPPNARRWLEGALRNGLAARDYLTEQLRRTGDSYTPSGRRFMLALCG